MGPPEADMTIGEVADRFELPASTLRYWESVGLLQPPRRVGGKRRYDPEALRRIEMILLAKRAGFTLSEARIVLSGLSTETPPPEVWRRLAARKLPAVVRRLAETEAMKALLEEGLRCECVSLEQCLRRVGEAQPSL